MLFFFFFQAEDGIRDPLVTGVQTCALPIWLGRPLHEADHRRPPWPWFRCRRHRRRLSPAPTRAPLAATLSTARRTGGRPPARRAMSPWHELTASRVTVANRDVPDASG